MKQEISLNGQWQFCESGKKNWRTASVPGVVHTDLLAHKAIPDPFFETNELDVQWIGQTDWIYKRKFDFDRVKSSEKCVLVCEGLDTVAEVRLNSTSLGKTNNQHRRYEFDVTNLLKPGVNFFMVIFSSPEAAADQEAKKHPYPLPGTTFPVYSPDNHYLRKTRCHGGWDWGPCLMTSGIWKDIYIERYDRARIQYVTTSQVHAKDSVVVQVNIFVDSTRDQAITVQTTLGKKNATEAFQLEKGTQKISYTIKVKNPKLWNPVGYGDPFLYGLKIEILSDEVCMDQYESKIGLRQVEIVTEKDQWGESMYFRVNGVPVFAKGANWIPADSFSSRVSKERYANLLESALAANMNIMRVWGGGLYESDDFYDFCDAHGMMVWQDFTFSCALYPSTPEYLANVREEATHQVRRLCNHPSLVLWCGNNECEYSLNWAAPAKDNIAKYAADYEKLFVDTLGSVVAAEKPDIPYRAGSPSNGNSEYGFPDDRTRGDCHYWEVWHAKKPFREYLTVRPRFSSEFGFQSFSSVETLLQGLNPVDLNVTSPNMEHRQRHGDGNSLILDYMTKEYRVPLKFEDFVYVSQLQQGLAIKTASEHWRRIKPQNMGVIYWQINDIWPAVSWSSLEYDGRWKVLHYFARKFFAPVLISAYEENDELQIWVTSDVNKPLSSDARIEIRDFTGRTVTSIEAAYSLEFLESKLVAKVPLGEVSKRNEVFVTLETTVGGSQCDNLVFLTPLKRCPLPEANLKTTTTILKNSIEVEIETDRCAFYVWLSFGMTAGVFSDNAFSMLPGEKKTVTFTPIAQEDLKQVAECLSARSLRDTY